MSSSSDLRDGAAPRAESGAAVSPVATAGELLRAAREKQGLHLAALAASLKVTPRKLELLEANRFDELPDATFTRALALSVCRVLKIDATPVLVRLPQTVEHGLEHVAQGLNQPFRDRSAHQEGADWGRILSLPVIAAVLLLIGAAVVYLMPERPMALASLSSIWSSASVGEAASAVVVAPGPAPAAMVTETVVPTLDVAASAVAPAASAVTETVFSAPPVSTSEAATTALVELRASGASWVEIRDRGGRALLSRTLNAGETIGVDGALPLKLVIGNADVMQLSFRGQPVPLGAATKDNVARLELK
ncbi:helix-turn-helix domain-containing protein [Rivibacter subsaxonicus]|nr:helix-turn-helix domain-containing protein [Rivibacter subsaxonicus]